MKNLLIIVPNLKLGGQERVAANTAEIMSDIYNITFVVFDGRDAIYSPCCEVVNLAIPAAFGKLAKFKNVLCRVWALRKLCKEKHIDFALSFGATGNLANVLAGKNGKTIINIRAFGSVSNKWMDRFVYGKSDTIVCCAKVICEALSQMDADYEKKIRCLYNPYDITQILQQGNESVTDYVFSQHTIVTHGRLDRVKNYPRLIKAFSLIKAAIPDAQLLMIGEGALRPQLETLIVSYHLEDSVTLLGFRKNPFAYLAKSSLYVLSSYSEGFPNALVEGMAFLPVVAVDCKSGPREILSDGPIDCICKGYEQADYGMLVQPAEKQEFCETLTQEDKILADAILSVLTNPEKAKALQTKAKTRVKMFSCGIYHKNMNEILEKER